MLCLGIESSCDDTSLALVDDGHLLAQVAASQTDLHALFGGVVPEMASREHARCIGPLCDELFTLAGLHLADVRVVAVARGPGLLGSLLVGVAFAKALALGLGALFVGVNHLHAHLMAVGLERNLIFPALGLLVSGGHTQLYRLEGPQRCTLLGRTLDDAAGEAFDKAGKILGLPYPAGRHIDHLAEEGAADPKLFPRPYLDNPTLDFSFSGLKTAMLQYAAKTPHVRAEWDAATSEPILPQGKKRRMLADVCASYRLAVVDTLTAKSALALSRSECADVKAFIAAGGVAANSLLRRRLEDLANRRGREFLTPSPALCTDNGAMIAYLGELLARQGLRHEFDLEAIPRGRAVPEDYIRS